VEKPAEETPAVRSERFGFSERLLRWNLRASFAMNLIILFTASTLGVSRFRGAWVPAFAAATSGYFSWSWIEYSLHRWIFHGKPSPAARGHALHHREPSAPIATPFFTGLTVAILLWLGLGRVLSAATTLFYISGMTVGYTAYGSIHYMFHQRIFRSPWLARLQRHHEIHHRYARTNFGITNRFIDRLMGTLR